MDGICHSALLKGFVSTQVRQIMKKWADLKCDGKRRIAALRGPNGTTLRKKKLGPVERMVHKILMMSPRGGEARHRATRGLIRLSIFFLGKVSKWVKWPRSIRVSATIRAVQRRFTAASFRKGCTKTHPLGKETRWCHPARDENTCSFHVTAL